MMDTLTQDERALLANLKSRHVHRYPREAKALALRLYVEGLSTHRVAAALGCSQHSVQSWIKKDPHVKARPDRQPRVTGEPRCDKCGILLTRSGETDYNGNVLIPNDEPDAVRCWSCRLRYGEPEKEKDDD